MDAGHLTSDEDLYSGYNEVHPALDSRALQYDEGFRKAVLKSSYGKRTATGMRSAHSRMGTAAGFRRSSNLTSSSGGRTSLMPFNQQPPPTARPMTAVRGAGYTSTTSAGRGTANNAMFDPMNQAKSMPSPFQRPEEKSPEAKIKALQAKCNELLEESVMAADRGEMSLALDKAKEAVSKERALERQREQLSSDSGPIPPNTDLSFLVLLNLAIQYANNEMYSEAINTYQTIIKNRQFANTGRLKVNIGNIHYAQNNYPKAIKFFRMALDQIPNNQKEMRMKIMENIGLSFVKLNQFTDAITAFEYIMSERPDYRTGLHLILSHYGLGDRENMKKAYLKLLDINPKDLFDEKYAETDEEDEMGQQLLLEVLRNDSLRSWERQKRAQATHAILTGAKLIAPVIGETLSQGYSWCIQNLRNSLYSELANDLEINKAVKHLRRREFNEAIETLKTFEKKEAKSASAAATNLSFLYILQNELQPADKYADDAVLADRYNAGALVNKGNCLFKQGDHEKAKEYYKEAMQIEASCIEAIYNLGLAHKSLGQYDMALDYFLKMQAIVENHHNCLFQIANIYELMNDKDQAMDWYNQLLTFVPSDATMLNKMSEMAEAERDRQAALTYLMDSYRYFPSHVPTLERLAAHYIESQMYEKAVKYLERAALVQSTQVKWWLMIAACYRRAGNYQNALQVYKKTHKQFPENTECLKYLIRICTDLGLEEASMYADKLQKLEKGRDRGLSGSSRRSLSRSSYRRSAAGSREGSASSSSSSGYLTATSPRSNSSSKSMNGHNGQHLFNGKTPVETPTDINRNHIDIDDDLGAPPERPTTSWKRKSDEDDFGAEDIELPE